MAQKESSPDIFADKLAEITKKHGQGSILSGNEILDIKRCSTGSLSLDVIMGGGYGLGKIVEAYGPESSGKAQPLYSKILTPTGWKTMGDMEIGTEVSTPNGGVAQVTGVFPQGPQAVFEVKTVLGITTHATLDHLWRVRIKQPMQATVIDVLSTQQLLDLTNGDFNKEIFVAINIAIPKKEELGAMYLMSNSTSDLDIWERIYSIVDTKTIAPCQCISINSEDKLYITDDYIVTHNTTIAITGAIQAQKAFPDKHIVIIDAEHALDRNYCKKLGLDMSKVFISQPECGEQGLDILEELISTGKVSYAIVDSVATLIPKSELDGEITDSSMGTQARLMSKALRKLVGIVNKTGTILFFTNQLRSKIGVVYGSPEVTSGGNALKFYASTRLDIRKTAGDKDGDEIKNIKVTIKTIKNKLAPPFRKCELFINFGEGVDKVSEVLSVALHVDLITKTGNTYSYDGTKLGVGLAQTKQMLKDNPEICDEIDALVRKSIYDLVDEDITVSDELIS